MQINNTPSVNFNGYKNLMTNSARASKNEGFTFLSMQLDNIGKNDLDIWKNVQERLFGQYKPSDIFTIELIEFFGNRTLLLADKNIDPNKYTKQSSQEMSLMKAYTWMADLMKRVMNENYPVKDKGTFDVFHKTIANILPLFHNDFRLANAFVLLAQHPDNHPQESALKISESIDKIMLDYLL